MYEVAEIQRRAGGSLSRAMRKLPKRDQTSIRLPATMIATRLFLDMMPTAKHSRAAATLFRIRISRKKPTLETESLRSPTIQYVKKAKNDGGSIRSGIRSKIATATKYENVEYALATRSW